MDARRIRLARGSTLSSPVRCCTGWPIIRRFCAARRRACVRRTADGFLRRQRQRLRRFRCVAPRDAAERWRDFSERWRNRIFFTARRIMRSAAVFRLQTHSVGLSPKDAVYQGRDRFTACSAQPGCPIRNACRNRRGKNSSQASWTVTWRSIRPMRTGAFMSAWSGWKFRSCGRELRPCSQTRLRGRSTRLHWPGISR